VVLCNISPVAKSIISCRLWSCCHFIEYQFFVVFCNHFDKFSPIKVYYLLSQSFPLPLSYRQDWISELWRRSMKFYCFWLMKKVFKILLFCFERKTKRTETVKVHIIEPSGRFALKTIACKTQWRWTILCKGKTVFLKVGTIVFHFEYLNKSSLVINARVIRF